MRICYKYIKMLKEVQNVSSCLQKKDTKLILNEKRKQKKNCRKKKKIFSFEKKLSREEGRKKWKSRECKKRKMRVKCWNCFWNEEGTLDCDIKILFFSLLFLISSAISMLSILLLLFFFENAKFSLAYIFFLPHFFRLYSLTQGG